MRTLSFHAGTAGKVQQNQVVRSLSHTQRKTYDRYQKHGNEDIDKSMTQYNLDLQFQGGPIEEVISDRLEKKYKGKKQIRKDAVVMREIIAGPSSEIFEGMTIEQKQKMLEKFIRDAKPWLEKEFGKKNVLGASGHLDETNPHVHFMIMPLTKDGRLSQKDFFKGPADLKRQHREFREHMNRKSWGFSLDNKYEDAEGVPLPAYKANAKAIEEKRVQQTEMIQELADTGWRDRAKQTAYDDVHARVLRKEREWLDEWEKDLHGVSGRLRASEERNWQTMRELSKREAALEERENRIAAAEARMQEREQDMAKRSRVLTAVAVTVLEGDPKRPNSCAQIREKGVEAFKPDSLQAVLAGSIEDMRRGVRREMGGIQAIQREIDRQELQDGPEM